MPARFIFRVGKNPKNIKRIAADNYNAAATITARFLYGKGASAVRVWGMAEFSGYFQAYATNSTTKQSTFLGQPFHLQMISTVNENAPLKETYKTWSGLQYIRNRDIR